MPLGVGFKVKAGVRNRALLADAGKHVLQSSAVACVIEHGAGGDERRACALCKVGKLCDASAILAVIGVMRGKIERRGKFLLETLELCLECA